MPKSQDTPSIPLPKAWTEHVRSAVLHVLSLAQYAAVYTRARAADSVNTRVRLKAEDDQLTQEVTLLREGIRIKDARMARIAPDRRPPSAVGVVDRCAQRRPLPGPENRRRAPSY